MLFGLFVEIILCILTVLHRVDRVISRTRPSPPSFSRYTLRLVPGNGIDSVSLESVINRPSPYASADFLNPDLSEVNVSSTIPHAMATNLYALIHLFLDECGLKGEFQLNIFQLPSLQFLSVSFQCKFFIMWAFLIELN